MNDSEGPLPPHPPYDEWRRTLAEHPHGHAALDELQTALQATAPQPEQVTTPVERLRSIPVIEAEIANWWDSPRTQNWLKILADAGL